VSTVLAEAWDVEADGWKGRSGSAVLARPAMHRFMHDMCTRFAAVGKLRVAFLRCGEKAIAMQICLEHEAVLWEIKIGYRQSHAGASPGRVILWESLRDCFLGHARRYELLGAGDAQQAFCATGARELRTWVYFPASASGAFALAISAIDRAWSRLRPAFSHRS
jgi:hypothetical protein